MSALRLANRYMEIFYSGQSLHRLAELFDESFIFEGPFYRFDNANDYLASLHASPPAKFNYDIIQSYQNANSACLVYRFSKPGIETIMAQVFEMNNNRICRIRLIFDSAVFDG